MTKLEIDSLDWASAWKQLQYKPGDSAQLPERWYRYYGTRSLALLLGEVSFAEPSDFCRQEGIDFYRQDISPGIPSSPGNTSE